MPSTTQSLGSTQKPLGIILTICLTGWLALFTHSPAVAATDLADVPMAVKNRASPNIMFTLDDSGSMQFEALPDQATYFYYVFPRANSVYGGSDYSNYTADFDPANPYNTFMRSSNNNKVYYNPGVTYKPWSQADGTSYANASTSCAPHNPYDPTRGCRDLTTSNTDTIWWYTTSGWAYGALSYWPATYFNFTGTNVWTPSHYSRVEIRSTTATYTKAATRTDCAGATTCTYAEEIQNFANWYTYYRSRVLTARAGVGRAFAQQSSNMRVGFSAINQGSATIDSVSSPGTVVQGVRIFSGTNRTGFFDQLYGHTIPAAGTPLRQAIDDVGQYFSRTDDKGPWGENPGTGGGTQLYCRQNYNILMTDGYWNGNPARTAAARANVDNGNGTLISGTVNDVARTYQYAPAHPYQDSWSDTLADVAMYYWYRDLRTDLPNKMTPNSQDEAFWQHMVNFTVGLGVNGTLNSSTDLPGLTAGTTSWPQPTDGGAGPNVDDLWHAAVNSRGQFFNANDPDTFASALNDALNNIVGREGAAAAVAVSNANVTAGDNIAYANGYNSGNWSGELNAYYIDLTTGARGAAAWTSTAQAQLNGRSYTGRYIATYSGSAGVAFSWTSLTASQQTALNSTPADASPTQLVDFLRGDRSREVTKYRQRASILADIVNAEPVFVTAPNQYYSDTGYSTFKTTYAGRRKMVYQAANDGMLHAFSGLDDAAASITGGSEAWAYVPSFVIGKLKNLSLKVGFSHQFYVDGTPVSGDVDLQHTNSATGTGTNWRTILVGGLGKGGSGYYALDVTSPSASSDADVATKVLWEFPNSSTSAADRSHVGLSYGKPIIVKTRAEGWVVLVTSGYNNGTDTGGDGQGYLFVLDARDGHVIKSIATGVGTAADPSGLAQISAYVASADVDATVEYVYGGDLKGNVWRFDLTAANRNSWNVKQLAALVNDSSQAQPVTTTPELTTANGHRMIFIGTGQYLGDSDIPGAAAANPSATQTQSMYALVDDLTNAPLITPFRSQLVGYTQANGKIVSYDDNGDGILDRRKVGDGTETVDLNVKKGWYIDFPDTGERSVTDSILGLGVLNFTTNVPNSDPCTPGGSSWVWAVDYLTGRLVTTTTTWSAMRVGGVLSSRPVLIKLPSGQVKEIITTSDNQQKVYDTPAPTVPSTGRRVSWRELIN